MKQVASLWRGRHGRSRWLLWCAGLAIASVVVLRVLIHFVPGAGPATADALRALFGVEAVARLQEVTARVEDRVQQVVTSPSAVRSLQDVAVRPPSGVNALGSAQAPVRARRAPRDVGPMSPRVAAAGDGTFQLVVDPARPEAAPLLHAALLHPDPKRPYSEVFIVTAPLDAVRLHAAAGTVEPKATTSEGRRRSRSGRVPAEHLDGLLAAFNGGFKTEHGQHGMYVDGTLLVPGKPHLCTIVGFQDGTLRIGTFSAMSDELSPKLERGEVSFFRQAAPCMAEGGKLNPALQSEETKNWGATLDGDVVIRRSAIGLDHERSLLYVAITNATTARALAEALLHAGASDVAQLDVNWSYPRILLFPRDADGQRYPVLLFKGFAFREGEYVKRASTRDFFYLVRRDAD